MSAMDQDEQDYQQLEQYMLKDLMNIIISYVPLVDFVWTEQGNQLGPLVDGVGPHRGEPVFRDWDTDIAWNGRFTYGTWNKHVINTTAKSHAMGMYLTDYIGDGSIRDVTKVFSDRMDEKGNFLLPRGCPLQTIAYLKCANGFKTMSEDQVKEELYKYYNGNIDKYSTFPFGDNYTYLMAVWGVPQLLFYIIKVPTQKLIHELEYIYNIVSKDKTYNTKTDFDEGCTNQMCWHNFKYS